MADQILAEVARSGILGAFLVLALLVIRRLDNHLKLERERHAEAERALFERILASKETDAAKLRELVAAFGRKARRAKETDDD